MRLLLLISHFCFWLSMQACALPQRSGYDRDRGSYAQMPRTAPHSPRPPSERPSTPSSPSSTTTAGITADPGWNAILESWLGTPYAYGGSTRQGTDCSGFVQSAYREKTGITLPRTSQAGFANGTPISESDLTIGDILYFADNRGRIDHAGIFIGNHQFIHASTSKGVIITSRDDPYWKPRYRGARRYP